MQEICIVIPCFNEQYRLPIKDILDNYTNSKFHYLFVNDGSTDSTIKVLNDIKKGREDRIFVLNLEKNQGKAEAVRLGILYALTLKEFSIIGYLDADLATPLSEVDVIVCQMVNSVAFAFGSRIKMMGTNINRKLSRHFLGRIFATFASLILNMGVYDTQCGAKFFNAKVINRIFNEPFITRWLFDVEVFARFKKEFGIDCVNTIVEVPLKIWIEKGNSKLKLKDFIKVPFDLCRIKLKY
jgi:dolichyl-phosphate beta-glucosyltransferase